MTTGSISRLPCLYYSETYIISISNIKYTVGLQLLSLIISSVKICDWLQQMCWVFIVCLGADVSACLGLLLSCWREPSLFVKSVVISVKPLCGLSCVRRNSQPTHQSPHLHWLHAGGWYVLGYF